jgi:cell division protein FtsB
MSFAKNPFQPLIEKIPTPFRNRYIAILCAFTAWMLFFDKHDVLTQMSLQGSIDKLSEDKVYYQQKIEEAKRDYADLQKNSEKYAREKYFMSRDNEQVFLIEQE